jgi:hypothetical protein
MKQLQADVFKLRSSNKKLKNSATKNKSQKESASSLPGTPSSPSDSSFLRSDFASRLIDGGGVQSSPVAD